MREKSLQGIMTQQKSLRKSSDVATRQKMEGTVCDVQYAKVQDMGNRRQGAGCKVQDARCNM
jgi:hypothetical protein